MSTNERRAIKAYVVTELGISAYYGCRKLVNITIDAKVRTIANCRTHQTINAAISMLCTEPHNYTRELREEIEQHCPESELTKAGIDKCVKLDSFLRETCRLNDFAVGTMSPSHTSSSLATKTLHMCDADVE